MATRAAEASAESPHSAAAVGVNIRGGVHEREKEENEDGTVRAEVEDRDTSDHERRENRPCHRVHSPPRLRSHCRRQPDAGPKKTSHELTTTHSTGRCGLSGVNPR